MLQGWQPIGNNIAQTKRSALQPHPTGRRTELSRCNLSENGTESQTLTHEKALAPKQVLL
jgi:hypothetical protein